MISSVRHQYNLQFSEEKYLLFLADLDQSFHHKITFRVAESPLFIDTAFKKKLFKASNEIVDFIVRDDFKKITERAIPKKLVVPNETDHTLFLALVKKLQHLKILFLTMFLYYDSLFFIEEQIFMHTI